MTALVGVSHFLFLVTVVFFITFLDAAEIYIITIVLVVKRHAENRGSRASNASGAADDRIIVDLWESSNSDVFLLSMSLLYALWDPALLAFTTR